MDIAKLELTIGKYLQRLSQKSLREIQLLCQKEQVQAGRDFIRLSENNKYEYFLIQGVVRSYLLSPEGDEITLSFYESCSILSPQVTRTHQSQSLLNFHALTDCELIKMEAAGFEKLIEVDLEIRNFANSVLRHELMQKVNKEIRLASWTARERLEQFRKDFHMLENIIPHPMIASYLGITNVSLSRLRKNS